MRVNSVGAGDRSREMRCLHLSRDGLVEEKVGENMESTDVLVIVLVLT